MEMRVIGRAWSALRTSGRRALARAWHAARRWLDLALHPLRRQRALARLAARPAPSTVLVVCHGNICRSPYAEAALKAALPEPFRTRIRVVSAGFLGGERPSPAVAIEVAARRGRDLSGHRSRPLDADLVRGADLVVVMEPQQARALRWFYGVDARAVLVLGDLDASPADGRAIRDPIFQPAEVFEECYAQIDRCVRVLAQAITGTTADQEQKGRH
jgi:protein-tyrosine phosphatase